MGRFPSLVRYGSKLVLEILPSVAATVIGGYLLTQLHFSRVPEPPAQPQQAAAASAPAPSTSEVPTVREDRAAMREVLKERRENPEPPAVVRPVVSAAPAAAPASPPAAPPTPAVASTPANPPAPATAQLPPAMDSIAPNEPVERAGVPARANVAAAPVALPRARPESVASVYAPAPPPGLPPAPAVSADAPPQVTPAAPAGATAPVGPVVAGPIQPPAAPPATPAPRHGVFSAISSIVGGAASATGNTVNWVIDLPGKAIEAGGRVIGIDPAPPPNRPFS
jgi:hypothetical protein